MTAAHRATVASAAQRAAALDAELEARRLTLAEEIRTYPGPIAGCDQQFNWLLDQMELVKSERRRLESLCAAALEAFEAGPPPQDYPHDTVHSH